jgi:hypothetical protein
MNVNKLKLQVKIEASEENVVAIVEPCGRVPHVKTTYLLTAPQDWASNVLHKVPEGVTYDETKGAPDEWFRAVCRVLENMDLR